MRNEPHPADPRREAGERAEEEACRFLSRRGLDIVARNYRGRGGEIDIVAREGSTLVFVEVRYRKGDDFGHPEESVGTVKRRRIVAAAGAYLATVPAASWREARFDVIAVEGSGEAATVRHFPAAFDASGRTL